jgi:membrane protein required for beta-lactamase induction
VIELLIEVAMRLGKVALAFLLAAIVWIVLTGPVGVQGSAELGLLCWLTGASIVLLVESSPL